MDKRTSIMIADNSEEFCVSLSTALQRTERFNLVGTACDGEQAMQLLEERKPDILVLDLMLAKKDGLSILKSMAGWERRPAVVATSGFMTDYVASAAAGLGVAGAVLLTVGDGLGLRWPPLMLAAAVFVCLKFTPLKKLHPIAFIGASALVGALFRF